MPALPPVPNVLRVTLKYAIDEDPLVVNRMFFAYTGTQPTNSALASWGSVITSAYTGHLEALAHPDVIVKEIDIVDLTTTTAGAAAVQVNLVGVRTGGRLPAGNCLLANYTIQRRYRGGKPRTYWPFGTATDLSTGQSWLATFTNTAQSALNAFVGQVASTPPTGTSIPNQVSVSYYKGFTVHTGSTGRASNVSTPRPTPVVDITTAITVDPRVATQRRRNRP